jgi:hypothetical protein
LSVRPIALALIVVAVALTAVGCGSSSGGDSGSSGSTSTSSGSTSTSEGGGETAVISKAGFIEAADAACARGKEQVETEFAEYLKENNIKKIGESGESKAEAEARMAEVVIAAIPTLQQQLKEIQVLGIPDGYESQINAYIDAAEEAIRKGEEDPQAMFTSAQKLFAASDKLADEIGFKVCGQR